MRVNLKFLSLPTSILLLVASHSEPLLAAHNEKIPAPWPFDLLSGFKHWPGMPTTRKAEATDHVRNTMRPMGVLKMSDDEGEKFYMEYWQFGGNAQQQSSLLGMESSSSLRVRDIKEAARVQANSSMLIHYRPSFALHTDSTFDKQDLRARGAAALAVLENRDFTCPTGTASCSAIGYPNSCCGTSETCFQIQDTGLGPVGCCPSGSSCGGTITNCDAPNTACADTLGGGCCIPNYVCAGVGCVMNSTTTAVLTLISTAPIPSSSLAQSTQTVITVITPVTSATTSQVLTISTSTYTGLQTTLACSTNSHPCPVAMGGGCCGNGFACASQSSCIATSSTLVETTTSSASVTGIVPVRPTGDTTSSTSSTDLVTTCPTGFYACKAYYGGGCCRTGRNCDTTSCPATSSTTIVSSGVTVVVPVGAAATTTSPSGSCASGWSTCAASVGGNCCPTGYACGTASCSLADATSTAVSPKKAPNVGQRLERGNVVLIVGALVGVFILL